MSTFPSTFDYYNTLFVRVHSQQHNSCEFMVSMALPCLQDGVLPSFSLSPRYQTEAADVTKDSKGLYSIEKIIPILSSVRLPEP